MIRLVLLRHGESLWNQENRFTGWTDVDLTPRGVAEAHEAARLLLEAGHAFDVAFVSLLKRAVRTLWIVQDELDLLWIPVRRSWRLNERHYGALQGLNKAETAARHGDEQVTVWRRSYDVPPPPLAPGGEFDFGQDARYAGKGIPDTESLKTTLDRVQPYWDAEIAPKLKAGETVLVAAHGNSLRAIVKLLFAVPDDQIVGVEIPTGNPLVVELDDNLRPTAARYLDTDRAQPLPPL